MEPIVFKSPERKHFLIETLEYCTFADVYRDLYKSYKDENCPTGVFIYSVISALIVSALGIWFISSGILTIFLWLIFGLVYASGRRDRDLEAKNAGAEFAIFVIQQAFAEMKAEAERRTVIDEDEVVESKMKTISAVLTKKSVRTYGFEDMAL